MKILVISPKNVYAAVRLKQEAGAKNQELSIMDMGDLVACDFRVDIKDFDVLYVRNPYSNNQAKYLPEVVDLAKQFKAQGKKVVDSVIANGILAEGKWSDYQKLEAAGLLIPKTEAISNYLLPPTSYPLILKWIYGFKAKHTFLVKDKSGLENVFGKYPKGELIFQEFIPAEFEYKVITAGYKALPVILRFKINDSGFRTNFERADVLGFGVAGKLTLIAEQASKVLGRELSKVDILESKGRFYILEVNRFPGLDSFEKLTGYNVAGEFIEYLAK